MISFAVQAEEAQMLTNFRALTTTQQELIRGMIDRLSHDTEQLVVVAGGNVSILHPTPIAPIPPRSCAAGDSS